MLRVLPIFVLFMPATLRADPLDLLPKQSGVVVKVETPRDLVESVVKLDAFKKLQAFPQVKEILDSPDAKRFLQLLAFVELSTGSKWPDLIEKTAGNGIALGVDVAKENGPLLVVIEGKDEATVGKVHLLFNFGIKDEAKRNTSLKISEGKHGDTATLTINGDVHLARVGAFTLISNQADSLNAGIDRARKPGSDSVQAHKSLQDCKKLVGPKAAAWLWFDLATAKTRQETKDFFENSRKEIVQTLLFGSTVDAARRADYVAAALYRKPNGYTLSVRMPALRRELDTFMQLHVPKAGMGTKPLLEPPGVIASHSLYLDLGHAWKNRVAMMPDETARKELEKGVADISKIIPGASLGDILEKTGPYHRIVMAHTGEKLYSKEPGQPIPPTAYVLSLRDPTIGTTLEGLLRAGGLLAGFQTGWTMSDETFDGVKIVSYKFPEKGEPKFDDPENLRFNAMPSFARVGDSLVVGSTPGIVKALIPILKKETADAGSREVLRFKVYAQGAAEVLKAYPDAAISDALLQQGITLKEARAQIQDLAQWLSTLGHVGIAIDHGDDAWRFDLDWSQP